jgi:hypothetical protein
MILPSETNVFDFAIIAPLILIRLDWHTFAAKVRLLKNRENQSHLSSLRTDDVIGVFPKYEELRMENQDYGS